MRGKAKEAQSRPFAPLRQILFVSPQAVEPLPPASITVERVGEKAFGLSCLPEKWTLPFVVVSGELLTQYRAATSADIAQMVESWADRIIAAALSAGLKRDDPIMVRSSGYGEGLEERGKFHSGEGTLGGLGQALSKCLELLASDADLISQVVPLVIQKRVALVSAKGHLSNERRCSEENRDWLGEFEMAPGESGRAFKINLRNWRRKVGFQDQLDSELACLFKAQIESVLETPAAWAYDKAARLHFEWVWDGKSLFMVQADEERKLSGVDPTKINLVKRKNGAKEFKPKCLKIIEAKHAQRFHKINNVFTYMKLGLPITPVYVLDDQTIIAGLAAGNIPSELRDDLEHLVQGSLVIRIDVATDDLAQRQLLPRTQEERQLDAAIKWLTEKSAEVKAKFTDDAIFIFHNFIPAEAAAFALAVPGERQVKIEALWGLPEGLYYNRHDKFTVDTKKPNVKGISAEDVKKFGIKEKRSFKRFFVAPDKDGRWTTQSVRAPFDWRQAIRKNEWIREIALQSRRIAEEKGKPQSIMWFVGVPKAICQPRVFPWYHEEHDAKLRAKERLYRTKTSLDRSLKIKTSADIETLRLEAAKESPHLRLIRIQPQEESLLRAKETLRTIGELAQKIGAVILMEGAVLSHAYYQLLETNATVEVLDPFEGFDDSREFNKLVRDKVPSNIEEGGEKVRTAKLTGEVLLQALKEKLLEEAFEVLSAPGKETILDELADVKEVVDELVARLEADAKELRRRQSQKKKRAGGFKDGIVLLETKVTLPAKEEEAQADLLFPIVPTAALAESLSQDGRELLEASKAVSKWIDRRDLPAETEFKMSLTVPLLRDGWTERTAEMGLDDSDTISQATVSGKRDGTKMEITLSILMKKVQGTLPLK